MIVNKKEIKFYLVHNRGPKIRGNNGRFQKRSPRFRNSYWDSSPPILWKEEKGESEDNVEQDKAEPQRTFADGTEVAVNGLEVTPPYNNGQLEANIYGTIMHEVRFLQVNHTVAFTPSNNEFTLQLSPKSFASKIFSIDASLSPQMEDLRLVYGTMGGYYGANGIHASEPTLDNRRRNSAVEVIFADELERSKPEADPRLLLLHSQSSSAFPMVYTELDHDWEAASLYEPRSPLTSFQPSSKLDGASKRPSLSDARDRSPRQQLTYTDVPYVAASHQPLEVASPPVFFYVDRPPQYPKSPTVDRAEERVVEVNPCEAPLKPQRNPAAAHPKSMEPLALPRAPYVTHLSMEEEDNVFGYGVPETPKRSLSQSDVKATRFPCGSEFRPLGPCPVLTSRKIDLLQCLLTQPPFPETPQVQRSAERYAGSGTESSDSDSDLLPDYYALYGRVLKRPRVRIHLSSGSLQLEGEEPLVPASTMIHDPESTSNYFM
ncbi:PREDICTED: FERM domain-containing protein 7-like [Thamnophis sirtalis]|uniref:FERM domain-containing protein 7-like n=1 Tax=Thamnophis sirtalis TaxID=35019 RepID=A0A6I9XSP5_9SAUR|nr:PREDICTED: FERM domain-containing protein 7-like [Thamnophis sirtalis]